MPPKLSGRWHPVTRINDQNHQRSIVTFNTMLIIINSRAPDGRQLGIIGVFVACSPISVTCFEHIPCNNSCTQYNYALVYIR